MYFSRTQIAAIAPLIAVLSPAFAQQGGDGGQGGFSQQFTSALQEAGFTQLANVINQLNGSDSGQQLLSQISNNSQNFTLFAPTDQAIQNLPDDVTGDQDRLANTLSYHFLYGNFDNSSSQAGGGGGGVGGGGRGPGTCTLSGGGGGGGGTCTLSGGGGNGPGTCTIPGSAGAAAGVCTLSSSGGGGGSGSGRPSVTVTVTDTQIPEESIVSGGPGSGERNIGEGDDGSGGGSPTEKSGPAATATGSLFKQLFGRQDNGTGNSSSPDEQPYSGVYPNTTIGRTLLNDTDLVQLEAGKNQVLAWTRSGEQGNVTILNQPSNATASQNITVVNSTMWQNFFINGIDGVLTPPGKIETALQAVNATAALSFLSQAQLPNGEGGDNETAISVLEDAHGITLFVPHNAAFTSELNQTLQDLQNNQPAIANLLQNHYINGTSLYSTQIQQRLTRHGQANATTAAGEPLTFSRNDTGLFVSGSNGTTAQIVRPDVLVENGVIHIVDRVFFNDASNQSSAESAYESASQSAAQVSTTETGPVGGIVGGSTDTASQGQSTDSSSNQTQTSTVEVTETSGSGILNSRMMKIGGSSSQSSSFIGPLVAIVASVTTGFVLLV